MVNIAVFASGTGSNAENLIRYFRAQDCGIGVALVVCNKPRAGVLERSRALGVPVRLMTPAEIRDPETMLAVTDEYRIDVIVLAGFLQMVPDFLIEKYSERVINIHPSLLPKFGGKGMYGIHVHEAVVAAGEHETGITIHHVTSRCDEGSAIFQARVDVAPTDTAADVEAKIHHLERIHFGPVLHSYLLARFCGDNGFHCQ